MQKIGGMGAIKQAIEYDCQLTLFPSLLSVVPSSVEIAPTVHLLVVQGGETTEISILKCIIKFRCHLWYIPSINTPSLTFKDQEIPADIKSITISTAVMHLKWRPPLRNFLPLHHIIRNLFYNIREGKGETDLDVVPKIRIDRLITIVAVHACNVVNMYFPTI